MAGATAYVAAAGYYNWPRSPENWWEGPQLFVVALLLIASNVLRTIVQPILSRFRDDLNSVGQRKLDAALLTLWRSLEPLILTEVEKGQTADEKQQRRRDLRDRLGLHVWLVPKWHRMLGGTRAASALPEAPRKSIPTPPMRLGGRLYLDDLTTPSSIRWTRGRGAIGMAWKKRDCFYFPADEKWPRTPAKEIDWSRVAVEDGIGLDKLQVQRLLQYGQVFVVPIWVKHPSGKSTFAGCIALDMPRGTSPLFRLNDDRVYEAVYSISRRLSRELLK